MLPPAYRCKLFSICMHVVNRQSFVFIFVLLFRASATYKLKTLCGQHTHTHTYLHTFLPIYILLYVCMCVCVFTCLITTLSCLSSLLRLRCCCAGNRSNLPRVNSTPSASACQRPAPPAQSPTCGARRRRCRCCRRGR